MKRLLAVVGVILLAAVCVQPLAATTAFAATAPSLSATPSPTSVGTTIVITGANYPKRVNGAVSVSGKRVGVFTTDSLGRFSLRWSIPTTTAPGSVSVTATSGYKTASVKLAISAAPIPTSQSAPACGSLQALVDAAAPYATVLVPACVYRESVLINKPLTLDGQGAAQIRGSDVWTNWTRSGSYWVAGSVPAFWTGGECVDGTSRCLMPEQVFVDGSALFQVAANPTAGQFAVDASRRIVLANDPSGHTVEVTTRTEWIRAGAANVTVRGFTMKHAATAAQYGAIANGGYANWTIANNVLSDAHGAVVSIDNATGLQVLNNDISRGGDLGIHGSQANGAIVRGNRIHDNNTEAFSPGWEAGGLKISQTSDLTIDQNEVYNNAGPGIWNDVDCYRVTISNNRVHHNAKQGIAYELSHNGHITGNVLYDNGASYTVWGWGAGILVQNSNYTEVDHNTVAWNGDGIAVISQNRWSDSWNNVVQDSVHDNVIISTGAGATLLGWFEDWAGVMSQPASNNHGYANRYWYAEPDGQSYRFEWVNSLYSQLSGWNTTPGEEAASYLTDAQRDQILTAAGIALSPQ
jgi:parallel beta-helix repeat protein